MLVSSRSSSYTPWTRTFVSSKMHIKCSLMIGCVWGIAKNVRLDLTLLAIDLYHEDLQLILLIWYYLPLCYKLQPRTCQRKKCLLWMEDFHARAFQSCTSHTQLFKGQCEKTMRTFIHLNDSVFWHCWFKLKIEKSEFVLVGGNFGEDFQMYPSTTTGDSFSDLRSWERWPWRWQRVDLILEALREPGYQVKAYMMISSDYGLPQRRVRLYFIGIHRDDFPNFRFDKVLEYLQLFRLRCQSPVLWFNDHCQTEQI